MHSHPNEAARQERYIWSSELDGEVILHLHHVIQCMRRLITIGISGFSEPWTKHPRPSPHCRGSNALLPNDRVRRIEPCISRNMNRHRFKRIGIRHNAKECDSNGVWKAARLILGQTKHDLRIARASVIGARRHCRG